MRLIETFIEYFNIIYQKSTGKLNYTIRCEDKNVKLVENWINRLSYCIDEYFIWDYIVYQFEYYKDKKTRFGTGVVQLNWITGKKALDRWNNKNKNWKYFNTQYENKLNIKKPLSGFVNNKEGRLEFERREKKRFFNEERGFLHCRELIFEVNELCNDCKYIKICQKI